MQITPAELLNLCFHWYHAALAGIFTVSRKIIRENKLVLSSPIFTHYAAELMLLKQSQVVFSRLLLPMGIHHFPHTGIAAMTSDH